MSRELEKSINISKKFQINSLCNKSSNKCLYTILKARSEPIWLSYLPKVHTDSQEIEVLRKLIYIHTANRYS